MRQTYTESYLLRFQFMSWIFTRPFWRDFIVRLSLPHHIYLLLDFWDIISPRVLFINKHRVRSRSGYKIEMITDISFQALSQFLWSWWSVSPLEFSPAETIGGLSTAALNLSLVSEDNLLNSSIVFIWMVHTHLLSHISTTDGQPSLKNEELFMPVSPISPSLFFFNLSREGFFWGTGSFLADLPGYTMGHAALSAPVTLLSSEN